MGAQKQPLSFYLFISASFFVAFLFQIFPLKSWAYFRPELVCILLVYWVVRAPMYFGVATAAFMGLLQDVITGGVWGAHMFAFSLVTYVCIVSHQRINSYSVTHQTVWIFVLVGVHQLVVSWFWRLQGYSPSAVQVLLPSLTSALLWPLFVGLMFRLRRALQINVPT